MKLGMIRNDRASTKLSRIDLKKSEHGEGGGSLHRIKSTLSSI